ncbi:hypothetical protein B0H13DRAFT_1897614 [Mycena leptocephala]|nr:hypothetical protein B0H13DRAFT_1897614 [Mycena leptocephala]
MFVTLTGFGEELSPFPFYHHHNCRARQIGCTEQPVTTTNNLKTAFPCPSSIKFAPTESRARSNSPACRDGVFFLRAFGMREERWDEMRGVGIGTASDAALEETSCKGTSLSDACLVHSVAPERSALLRAAAPLHPNSIAPDAGAFFRKIASREAEAMVEVGGPAERLS